PRAIAVEDFNRDGYLDLVTANFSSNLTGSDGQLGTVSVLLGDGSGNFTESIRLATGDSGTDAVAVGDFNRGGKADIAAANVVSNSVSILLGSGDGQFTPFTSFNAAGPTSVMAADFD